MWCSSICGRSARFLLRLDPSTSTYRDHVGNGQNFDNHLFRNMHVHIVSKSCQPFHLLHQAGWHSLPWLQCTTPALAVHTCLFCNMYYSSICERLARFLLRFYPSTSTYHNHVGNERNFYNHRFWYMRLHIVAMSCAPFHLFHQEGQDSPPEQRCTTPALAVHNHLEDKLTDSFMHFKGP